jgi:hypothetical protein
MARRRAHEADADASKPKQLRKRLRKAEDQLADAQIKRDRAQARVEALSIIADEIRAQLAALEKAAAKGAVAKAETPAAPQRAARAPRTSTTGTRTRARSAGTSGASTRKATPAQPKGTASSAVDVPKDMAEPAGAKPAAKASSSRTPAKPRTTSAPAKSTSRPRRTTARMPRGSSTGRGRTNPPTP